MSATSFSRFTRHRAAAPTIALPRSSAPHRDRRGWLARVRVLFAAAFNAPGPRQREAFLS